MATHIDHQFTKPPMPEEQQCIPLLRRLAIFTDLTPDDEATVRAGCQAVHEVPAKRDLVKEGDRPLHVHLVLEGWAARYRVLPNGSRQVTAFLLPGDFCDIHTTVLGAMDHSIMALTRLKVALIAPKQIEEMLWERPNLGRALWWSTLVDEAVLRAWIVNIGARDAEARISHLFCEMHARMRTIGLVHEGSFDLPLTQENIGDALGLTSVHINRVLQGLRRKDLITWKGGSLSILNMEGLRRLAGFDPNYLHRGKLSRMH